MCHLYLLYSARSLGLGNQFHKDTGLISAAVHIMRRALLLSSAELPARGHEQINRDVTQLPHSPAPTTTTPPPQRTQRWEGDVVRGVQRTKHPARERLRPLWGASCYARPSEFHHQCVWLLYNSEAPVSSLLSQRVCALCGSVYVCAWREGGGYEACRHPLSDYLRALFADLYRPTTTPSIICPAVLLLRLPRVPPRHRRATIIWSDGCNATNRVRN